jgi:hypothetical protein
MLTGFVNERRPSSEAFLAFNAASISSGSVIRFDRPVDGSRKKKC